MKLQPKVATEEVKTIEDKVFDQVSVELLVLRHVQYVLLIRCLQYILNFDTVLSM